MQPAEMNKRRVLIAVLVIFAVITAAIHLLQQTTFVKTVALPELYYLPIAIAAVSFGWVWGLITAIACSIAVLLQLISSKTNAIPIASAFTFGTFLKIFLFLFVGISAGILSDAERKRKEAYHQLNIELDKTNQKLQQRVLELTTLYETARHLSATLDVNAVMSNVMDAAIKALNGNAGFLYLLDPDKKKFVIRAARGNIHNTPRRVTYQTGEEMLEVVTRTQEGILVAEIEKSQEYTLEFDDPDRVDIRSIICVPLIARNQIIGALSISNSTQASAWDPQCLHLMMILAGEAAIAVDNALMYQRVNDAYVEIIGNLVGSIEPKDMAAVEHSSRTMHIASELAQRMGLEPVDINAVRYVVLIHNLGKVGLDSKLVTRTDVFLNEVRKSLRSIAVSDQTALASLHFLERVNPIIKYQHEWYNGGGIPEGKKENEIPLGSRIVSVVDSFHRLVYPSGPDSGAPLSVSQAIEQIQFLAGTQFDPAVVTTFVKIINEAPTEPLITSLPEVK